MKRNVSRAFDAIHSRHDPQHIPGLTVIPRRSQPVRALRDNPEERSEDNCMEWHQDMRDEAGNLEGDEAGNAAVLLEP